MGKIQLKPEQLTEWNGFDVYDVETGENLLPSQVAEISFPKDKRLPQIVDGYCLDWEGRLCLTIEYGDTAYIPKDDKYLIQINGEKYMRW